MLEYRFNGNASGGLEHNISDDCVDLFQDTMGIGGDLYVDFVGVWNDFHRRIDEHGIYGNLESLTDTVDVAEG